jgi:hypothetical protein
VKPGEAKAIAVLLAATVILGGALFLPDGPVQAQTSNPGPSWTCALDDIGATLTRCALSADVPSGLARYITDITAQSTTTTGGGFILRTGTGTNCGTGTVSLFPGGAATAARWGAAASTAAPTTLTFRTPILVPDGKDLCVLGRATDTTTIQITGYLAPK